MTQTTKKAFIDLGHGGKDPGAIGNDLQEKDVVLPVGLGVGGILARHKVDVSYSRASDLFIGLAERANQANEENADVFVSLHANSATSPLAQGLETFHYPGSIEGLKLSNGIQKSILESGTYTKDRGVKTANFAVLRLTKMPACLVELAFISNLEDSLLLRNEQEAFALAIAKGILSYLGIQYIDEKPIPEEKPTLYKVQVGAYSIEENAKKLLKELQEKGFNGFIIGEGEVDNMNKNNVRKSKYYKNGDAHIIETTPDNLYIEVIGDTLGGRYGINGTFFDTKTAPVSNPQSCVFIAINDGKVLSNNAQFNGYNAPPRATIIYHKDKKLGFRQVKDINSFRDNSIWAIGGYMVKPYMDFKNEQIPSSINYKTAHTYIGYDSKGKVYLIVKPNHNIYEIAPLLNQLGITNAIVLDGGGSSQLNHPGGNYKSSRKINTAILLKEE